MATININIEDQPKVEVILREKYRAQLGDKVDRASLAQLAEYAVLRELVDYWDKEAKSAYDALDRFEVIGI
jgi:hypothetical protein